MGFEFWGGVVRFGDCGEVRLEICFGFMGSGVWRVGFDGLWVDVLLIVVFRIWVRVGLMLYVKYGGRGVWVLVVVGLKLDGIGFEKL